MSKRAKLEKFAALDGFTNVFQNFDFREPKLIHLGHEVDLKNKWSEQYFRNDHPIVLELACGTGVYTNSLAKLFPGKNFIGVDIKGNRIWRGALTALESNTSNVAFVRTKIELLETFFASEEISEIWITFPDPFSKTRKQERRLTSPRFLELYKRLLPPNGIMHLKTDAVDFYTYTKDQLREQNIQIDQDVTDVYALDPLPNVLDIQTKYERMHLADGKKIMYLQWGFQP